MNSTDEFLQDFVDEAKSHIETIELAVLDTDAFVYNDEIINNVFRAIHSIKGTAGFFNLKTIVALSHAIENVLGQVRAKTLPFSEQVLDCFLDCNDQLKQMVFNVELSETVDVSQNINRLKALLNAPLQEKNPQKATAKKNTTEKKPQIAIEINKEPTKYMPFTELFEDNKVESLYIYNKNRKIMPTAASVQIDPQFAGTIEKNSARGHKAYKIVIPDTKNAVLVYKRLNELFSNLAEIGEVVNVFADTFEQAAPKELATALCKNPKQKPVRIEILATSVIEYDQFCEAIGFPQSLVVQIKTDFSASKGILSDAQQSKSHQSKPDESIRVNVRLLDSLMALSGEMVLARNSLLNASSNEQVSSELSVAIKNVNHLTSKLQQEIMKTRLQHIGNVFNKFPRIIRDISKTLCKDISLIIEGDEIELDKTMLESLVDPITHLIRNAADHGIEAPEIREQLGKPHKGQILLKASHQGSMIELEISDDGAGVDQESVKQKAVFKKLITSEKAAKMSEKETYQLLFLPGFSMAEKVSDMSGRGVGMDVVFSNITKLGGSLQLTSEKGQGTKVLLTIPRTLSIVRSLMVGAMQHRFAIPQASIIKIIALSKSEAATSIEKINSSYQLRLSDRLIPVISLAQILNITQKEQVYSKIVLIRVMKSIVGIAVDEIYDTEETLIKPLPTYLKSNLAYSGVTIMGDGKISLILDADGIATMAKLAFEETEANKAMSEEETRKKMLEYQNMLLFKCSGSELYCLDLNMISRVETVHSEDIESIGDKLFVTIRGKSLRIIRPEEYLPVQKEKYKSQKLVVIVPNLVTHPIGILAKRIVDNVKDCFELDTQQLKKPGIFGTMTYNNHIVLALNLYELFEKADPANHPKVGRKAPTKQSVLIVEDTPFFQHIESQYLQEAGYIVEMAENGVKALALLEKKKFDIIISDIIMPVMDGLELITQIRSSSRYKQLPAIALSSMSSESYKTRAIECGFDAYENKLNKETLVKTVENILKSKKGSLYK